MLYTSGSTGKPKGVLHTVGGWMVHAGAANKYALDVRPGDVFWWVVRVVCFNRVIYMVQGV